jgi:alkanesulfonate monooxygenase SsuD/methylene tetrahydromethanopterin reductase-like flavin-dependent oxidoreductase (luciferase family)
VADSLAYPKDSDSTYPYTADGSRTFLEDKEFIETFVLCAAMGAVTSRLRFTPFVLKLPVRPPVLVAKQAASVAALTGNRLALGVGISPWPEDFEIMGVPFAKRGKRMDECMDIVRGLTAGGYFEFHGEFYDIPAAKLTPVAPVPILIGGHGEPALRRAARAGDGWMHGGGDLSELPALLKRLKQLREEYGRADAPFEVHAISLDGYTIDGVRRLEDTGVTDVIVGFRWPYHTGPDQQPLQDKLDLMRRFAEEVVQHAKV